MKTKQRYKILFYAGLAIVLLFWVIPLPRFSEDYATLLLSEEGDYLNAQVSKAEQWRFEPMDSIPANFEQALLLFEDRHFYWHPGVDPTAIVRAIGQNIKARKIVSGGSTITMQVARLSRQGKARNMWQKLVEMGMAFKMEIVYSKKRILSMYVSNAPFGGNTVGLEAAAWRYFQRSPYNLSWAEVATLAVLPNAPSLIYPGKNSELLKAKRNRLLRRLKQNKRIDESTYQLAVMEVLPQPPKSVPERASHLMQYLKAQYGSRKYRSTLSLDLQTRTNKIVAEFAKVYADQGTHNLAALVLDLRSNSVKAYVGNSPNLGGMNGRDVDIIRANRSSGSILKPFLYAAALSDATILPKTLLPDIPTFMNGFSPENFNRKYDGLVAADEAMVRSLNIPFVMLLKEYGVARFYTVLKRLKFTSFNKPPEHYGLSMILGGGEVSLWELARAYASVARFLQHDSAKMVMKEPSYLMGDKRDASAVVNSLSPGSLWITLNTLTKLKRPDEESGWHYFSSSNKIAWKTGTSFGFRDAWALGMTSDYLVAVWVGNADGQGVPGLTGTSKAAPVMFRIFEHLKSEHPFFDKPWNDLTYCAVCHHSGLLMSPDCEKADTILIPSSAHPSQVCTYHQTVHLSADKRYRVNSNCYSPDKMIHQKWFVLAPKYSSYYRIRMPDYRPLPAFLEGCNETKQLSFVYPMNFQRLYQPVDFDGQENPVVFEAVHENVDAEIRWFVDEAYVGSTSTFHHMPLILKAGKHKVSICDLEGNEADINVSVLEAKE